MFTQQLVESHVVGRVIHIHIAIPRIQMPTDLKKVKKINFCAAELFSSYFQPFFKRSPDIQVIDRPQI